MASSHAGCGPRFRRAERPRRRSFLPRERPRLPRLRALLLAAGVVFGIASPAGAASIAPNREIASAGDLIRVDLSHDIGLALPIGGLRYTYRIPAHATYVPNSVTVNGGAVADGGAVSVMADSVRVDILLPSLGVNTVSMQVRAVGAIGEAIVHRGAIGTALGSAVTVYGPATWIEDENARLYVCILTADGFISQSEPGFNFGGAPLIEARNGTERRPLFAFDLGTIPSLSGRDVVQAARLELWPTVSAGPTVTLSAHRSRAKWTEGTQSGAACTGGATWNTRNCFTSWPAGGDYDPVPAGSSTVDATNRFTAIDVQSVVADWVDGSRSNYGFEIVASSSAANRSLTLPTREGASPATPVARLVVVVADRDAYSTPAVSQALAEIAPTTVLAGAPSQRFVYSFLPSVSSSTGMNRFTITIPAGFSVVSLDTVTVNGTALIRNSDAVLATGEFENWGAASVLDVRFAPVLAAKQRVNAVFRATVPAAADPAREFLSLVDHDRRGYPAQSTTRGEANGDAADGNTWSVTTIPGSVTLVTVTPADTSVAAGLTVPYRAFATFSTGSIIDVTATAQWAVTPPLLGSFAGTTGVMTALHQGSGTVRATFNTVTSAPATVTVGPPELRSITVTPPTANVAAGIVAAFDATAFYSDGTSAIVTASAAWSASEPTIAQVVAPGQLRGLSVGGTKVAADYNGFSDLASLDVTPAQLISISISPADTTVALGQGAPLRALGLYSDGNTGDVTSIARWVAAPAGIIDIDANGLATSLREGTASVTASVGSVQSGAARFAVGPALLLSLTIAPADTAVALGFDVQYHAHGTYTDGTIRDVSAVAAWSTVPPGVAAVDAAGLAQTVGTGTTAVSAVLNSTSSPAASLTVGPAVVVSLDGAPNAATVPLGATHDVASTAHYSDGSDIDVTASAAWQSLDPAIADFTSPGHLVTTALGSARLVHSFAGTQGDTLQLDVTGASLDSVVVTPGTFAAPAGVHRSLTATAYFTDGSTPDVTAQAAWSSSAPAIATVSSLGEVQTVSAGMAQITANVLGLMSAPCTVVVDPASVTQIVVSPADTTVSAGQALQYTAQGTADGVAYDLTALVTWTSDQPAIATIASGGTATAWSAGAAGIHAQYAARTADATLNVTPALVVGLDVLPASSTLRLGGTKAMSARATYSNGATADVTAQATWTSTVPAIVFVEADGLARALALGSAGIGASYSGQTAANATLQVLPAVQVEAPATGTETVTPASAQRAVLALRFTNRYLDVRRVTAVRVAVDGPAAEMHFHVDDGDGIFEPAADAVVAEGAPSGGTWSATGLALDLGVGTSRLVFVSADVSLTAASHGAVVNATLPDVTDIFWQTATAVVPIGTFPLDSSGEVRVRDLGLAQVGFTPGADSVLTAGHIATPLFEMQVPADGLAADTLDHIELVQQGSAREGLELTALRLQAFTSGWQDVTAFVPSGGGRWTATGTGLPVPTGGLLTRIVADIAITAAANRTVHLQLPALGLGFASGRRGPIDGAWAEPVAHRIDSPAVLQVQGIDLSTGAAIARTASRIPVLGLQLTARGVPADTLHAVRFDNQTTNAAGAPPDPNSQIGAAELWLDTNADGAVGQTDVLLETLAPGPGSGLEFGTTPVWSVPLPVNQPLHLLVTLSPDSTLARDGERLSVRFAAATTGRALLNVPLAPLEPGSPPIVDGQSAAGYQVRRVQNTLVTAGTQNVVVLDAVLPPNGFADDELNRLRITNAGSADAGDVAALRLVADDGNGTFGPEDAAAGSLAPIGSRTWEVSGLAVGLPGGSGGRFYVVLDVASGAVAGRTFVAQAGIGEIEVASGNDGPNDQALNGGGPIVFTVRDQVLWVAGVAGTHAVAPDAVQNAALVLETLNAYSTSRTLQSLRVTARGTAAAFEYDRWDLFADANQNGVVDPDETPLALGTLTGDVVLFDGFQYVLEPLRQQRLLVTYALAPGLARDGSIIDAAIVAASDFGYASAGGATVTAAEFEMNSAGQDEVDGMVARQVGNGSVVPQTLGGGETNVLALDLTVPSNGWSADALNSLTVAFQHSGNPARFGAEVDAIRLWRETDPAFQDGRFDPSQDVLLQSVLPGAQALRFDALATAIPAGGRRFYVTVDVGPAPEEGREIQLGVPVGGIQVLSGNDGPSDGIIAGNAVHRISASPLLATVAAAPLDLTVGQTVVVTVAVRNRGAATLAGVVPQTIAFVPPLATTLLTGPAPAQLTLAPGASDTLHYEFRIDAAGRGSFTSVVGLPDSSVVSEPAVGPVLDVRAVPTAIRLEPRSNLPAVVSRGQENTTPVIWRLSHPDQDPAGRIVVHGLELHVESATGTPQSARDVFDQLEIRSAGVVRTLVAAVPDTSVLTLALVPPIQIRPGETVDVPLAAGIAANARASSFQVRITASGAVTATDASGTHAVGTTAVLPWTSPVTAIRTTATDAELTVTPQMPAGVNRGQTGVAVGTLRVALPGNPGESEARVVRLAVTLQDSAGAPLDPARVWSRVEVWSQNSLLLAVDAPSAPTGTLTLPLLIPRAFASGAPADLLLQASIRSDAAAGLVSASIAAGTDVFVQDAIAGSTLQVTPVSPPAFPAALGTSRVFDAAQDVDVTAVSRVAPAVAGGATLDVADVGLVHTGAATAADVFVRALRVRVTDPQGTLVVPRDVVAGMEVREGGTVQGVAAAIPVNPDAVEILLQSSRRIAAGARADFTVHAVLAGAPAVTAFRFALEGSAFDLQDANDPTRAVSAGGTLPFATNTVQIVLPPSAVEFGVVTDPPVNVLRGQQGTTVLVLQVRHPGVANEAALTLSRLVLHTRDRDGRPLAAAGVLDDAALHSAGLTLHGAGLRQIPPGSQGPGVRPASLTADAVVDADSLTFDLSAWPEVEAGQSIQLTLDVDVNAATAIEDLRFAAGTRSLRAATGTTLLTVRAAAGAVLPYESPTIHLSAPDLESTFANYPNPFAAGRQSTHVAFFLAADAKVTMDVCTLTGERVIRLLDGAARPAGLNDDLTWDGRNGRGEVVRNGTYVLCIDVQGPGGGKLRRKLAVVR